MSIISYISTEFKTEFLKQVSNKRLDGAIAYKQTAKLYPEFIDWLNLTYQNQSLPEQLYQWLNPECVTKCIKCSKQLRFYDWQHGFRLYCSPTCRNNDRITINKKSKKTCLARYGVDNSMKSKEIRQKAKETILERYGVDNVLKSHNIKQKIKNTTLERYGVENVAQSNSPVRTQMDTQRKATLKERYGVENPFQMQSSLDKRIKTWFANYGVSHPHQNSIVRNKFLETNREKFGVDYPMQNGIISEKALQSSKRSKIFILPSGSEIKIQGFEPKAIQELLDLGFQENDIITSRAEMPEFWWIDDSGISHRYYPDIWVISTHNIIEVKSLWTSKIYPAVIEKKKQSILNAGYNFDMKIY